MWYHFLMNTCEYSECNNLISRHGKKFCSLTCANRANARRGRTTHSLICANQSCSKEFESIDRMRVFCSSSCAAQHNNRVYVKRKRSGPPRKPCFYPECGTLTDRSKYCSTDCRHLHEIDMWFSGILDGNTKYGVASYVRRFLENRSEGRCEGFDDRSGTRCTETRVLQVDHIHSWEDSRPYSVRMLCPTCHALTPNYAGKNRNRGRTWKQAYPQYSPKISD